MRLGSVLVVLAVAGSGCASEDSTGAVVYLDRDGVTLHAGSEDDAAANVSSLVNRTTVIAPSMLPDAAWSEVVRCVQTAYAAFDVRIVDQRPAGDDFTMAVFGGDGSELSRGADQHGLAPYAPSGVDRAVAFVFAQNLSGDVAQLCNVAVHELAHTFGVDHQLLASEPTSYLPFDGRRAFVDVDAPCGETEPRVCRSGASTQNSFRILMGRLGRARDADGEAPTVELTVAPSARSSLAIRVRATDATGIGRVVLTYTDAVRSLTSTCGDGTITCNPNGSDYTFTVPGAQGRAVFQAVVVDVAGNETVSAEIEQQL